MQCPACSTTLQMTERQGIEIDYCPQCRGVWLDRGELDKIIERSNTVQGGDLAQRRPPDIFRSEGDYRRSEGDYRRDKDDDYGRKRRKNWLEEIFD